MPPGRRTLRNPSTFKLTRLVVPVFVLLGALSGDSGERIVFWAFAALMAFGALWPRLVVDEEGLTVVNIRAHHYRWRDMSDVTWRYRLGCLMLELQLVNGGHRVVWAVALGHRFVGEWWVNQTYSLVRDRWELATGRLPPILHRYVR